MTHSPAKNERFQILSLDGGGIRGAFTAGFLAEIERQTRRPVADHFDLIAGTSTGGIIAVALAMGETASSIETFYRDRGPKIFTRPVPMKLPLKKRVLLWATEKVASRVADTSAVIDSDWVFQAKYQPNVLQHALLDVFQHRTLEHAKRRLVVPAVDLVKGQTVVFKTPHAPDYVRDRHYRAVDVVMATTAAPTYFPAATITPGSAYADGGLWANNPAICAYAEAMRISEKCKRGGIDPCFSTSEIAMLSIGTGRQPYFLDPSDGMQGALQWGMKLFDVMGGAQSQGISFQAAYLLGDDRHVRIDFDLPGKWPLDAVEYTDKLIHIGQQKAIEHLARIRPQFLDRIAPPYTPFPTDAAKH